MYLDDCRLKGVVNLVLRDADGKVKQHKTIRNKVTRAGIAHIIGRMIDDGQDRGGLHKMPRMMSHMAIGIGAAARNDQNTYEALDFDSLPNNIPGVTDTGFNVGTAPTVSSRKRAAIPASYDKMLQDERGFRVQLMKDTTLATDYATLQNQALAQATDANSAAVPMHATENGKSVIRFETGSGGNPSTLSKLRVGLQISGIAATSDGSTPNSNATSAQLASPLKIEAIETGITESSSASKITLSGALPGSHTPASNSTKVNVDIDYVDRISLTTYSTNSLMPNHPTTESVKSVFQPNGTATTTNPGIMGPFGAAQARGNTFTSTNPYKENGKGLLGITRGQIGAFYEREIEYNIELLNTDTNGLPLTTGFGTSGIVTTVDEAAFAVLDGTTSADSTSIARFPFLGAEEDKPSGTTGVIAAGSTANNPTTRGTEFVQFGTAVDGIFQGALIGSSIIADGKNTLPEGYPEEENDYGQIGGLTVTGTGGEAIARYNTAVKDFVKYNPAASYAPNAVAGAKKNGDRIVYVATFKENNPRPEVDYKKIHQTSNDVTRAPQNRVYPITEAGIFNKHRADLGIFDVADRAYTTPTDSVVNELAHIDSRTGLVAPTSGTQLTLTANGDTNIGPVDGVLTSQGKSISAHAYGFTQGPISQTMLCRTTFDPVNKATADTLQITWSVQLQDSTI
jgi:hypothetical protein